MPAIHYEKTTEEMQQEYHALYTLMGKRVLRGNIEDSLWLFWNQVSYMVDQSDLPMSGKCDCFGIIRNYLTGGNYGDTDYWSVVRDGKDSRYFPAYVWCEKQYRFAERLCDLGEFWKAEIRSKHSFGVRGIVNWLVTFQKEIVPFVDAAIEACERDWMDDFGLTGQNINRRKAKLWAYQAMLKRCQFKLQGAREAIDLMIEE